MEVRNSGSYSVSLIDSQPFRRMVMDESSILNIYRPSVEAKTMQSSMWFKVALVMFVFAVAFVMVTGQASQVYAARCGHGGGYREGWYGGGRYYWRGYWYAPAYPTYPYPAYLCPPGYVYNPNVYNPSVYPPYCQLVTP